MLLSVSLLGNCMAELEESYSKNQKISQGNEAVHEFAHKAVHSTQKIVYIRLCLCIIQVHEQFINCSRTIANCLRTFANLVETFFAKYRTFNIEVAHRCLDNRAPTVRGHLFVHVRYSFSFW